MSKQKKLHPSVKKFKNFVQNNPKIIQEVRNGHSTWQELYEEWYLLGEEDPRWDMFRNEHTVTEEKEEKKSDLISQVMGLLKKIDPNQMQEQLQNVSKTLGAIQGVIAQFQGNKGEQTEEKSNSDNEQPRHRFFIS
ncbi:YlbD family protein [Bacillus aquiflavi]|uniref:YlbD family protein n=1 Tax=Bacillus aquiflavi TaxID=2672567 RepID=UPI001CA89B97|nr:YlbD family protein [Bacillus aquiflavi]UAC49275.1 YlbD family protein [Bacillus aquiflavi]